ncbi:MAG: nitrilase [Gammaproteobacteria bacterium]|nr:nitrilase [Gammaproteobacteria bacterium]
MTAYTALALQITCQAVNKCADAGKARRQIFASIETVASQVAASKQFIGPHVKLVVLPEYFLTSYPQGESIEQWREKGCIDPDGKAYEALGRIASDNGIYLSGNVYETDPHFPTLYFQTSFLLGDTGNVLIRYRRLVSMFAPTPYDVLDRYLDAYGEDSLFPVADTALGRLGMVASEEILFPEITRALTLKGAEVICHSSSEVSSPMLTPKNAAKVARAAENHVYVVSANSAGIRGIDLPNQSVDQGSKVIDYSGRVLAEAAGGESLVANAELSLDSLRSYRRRPGLFNVFTRQRLAIFEPVYQDAAFQQPNGMLDDKGQVVTPDRSYFLGAQRAVIDRLAVKGII